MAMAWLMPRPAITSSSSALSNEAESLPPGAMMGNSFLISAPNKGDSSTDWRACIQFTLPRSVLISPLWAMNRYGCASCQVGNVLVEKRWCTRQSALVTSGSLSSG